MSWVAVGIAGSSLISGAMSNKANKAQQKSSDKALNLQREQFDTVRADTAPAREVGSGALYRLADILGIDRPAPVAPTRQAFTTINGQPVDKDLLDPLGQKLGYNLAPTHAFGLKRKKKKPQEVFDEAGYNTAMQKYSQDVESFNNRKTGMDALQFDPGYQFRLDQSNRTLDRFQSANRLTGGRAIKEALRYGQDFASNEFNNATNRLFTLAGYGPSGVNASASAGANAANNMSNITMQQGNIAANNAANINNAVQGGVSNYLTYRTYNDWNKRLTPNG